MLDYQLTFNGLTMGAGTNIGLLTADGLEELPEIRSSDVLFAAADGETAGQDFAAGRDITVTFNVLDSGAGDYFTTIEAIKAALTKGTVEQTLTFQLPGRAARTLNARVRRRHIPVDLEYSFRFGKLAVMWHATDPRIYGEAGTQTLGVSTASSWAFDLTVGSGADLAFDLTGGTGTTTCTNGGNQPAYPVITVSTPSSISSFTLTNQTTGQTFTVNQTVVVGAPLIADMRGLVTGSNTAPVTIAGTSVYGTWVPPRTPFYLAPGNNVLRFDATGDAATSCQLAWNDTYL